MSDVIEQALRRHPLADVVTDDLVVSDTDSEVLTLSAFRADLLITGARARRRVVFRSAAGARMTEAMASALRDTAGVWLVEDDSGTGWNGLTGQLIERDVDLVAPLEGPPRIAPAFAAGSAADSLHLVLAASIRHRSHTEPTFGSFLDRVSAGMGAPPAAYGPHEPPERRWNARELSALLARRLQAPRLIVAGRAATPMTAAVLARRTEFGFEEVVETTISIGPVNAEAGEQARDRLVSAMDQAAAEVFPLFAFALLRPGRRDLTFEPVLRHAPAPLAVLIGPPGCATSASTWDGCATTSARSQSDDRASPL